LGIPLAFSAAKKQSLQFVKTFKKRNLTVLKNHLAKLNRRIFPFRERQIDFKNAYFEIDFQNVLCQKNKFFHFFQKLY
jgi:hypothetical protein